MVRRSIKVTAVFLRQRKVFRGRSYARRCCRYRQRCSTARAVANIVSVPNRIECASAMLIIENCAANEPRSSSAISYQPSAFSQTLFISCAGINSMPSGLFSDIALFLGGKATHF